MKNEKQRNVLIALAVKYRGNWNEIFRHIEMRDYPSDEEIEDVISNLKCEVVTYFDEEYPTRLKEIRKPPFVLFYYGDISLIKDTEKCLSIVGTRDPSIYGLNVTKSIVYGLNEDIVVVSGMALGIDSMAHQSAIESNHRTVAVLGTGINVCYPSSSRKIYESLKANHLVLSEFPVDYSPVPEDFPTRNRIVAGLSKCTLVTEAHRRSGTTVTIGYALEASRDVLCVPSQNLGDSACNLCIKDGGFLVENSDDVNYFYDH